jgi:hypothetical protein
MPDALRVPTLLHRYAAHSWFSQPREGVSYMISFSPVCQLRCDTSIARLGDPFSVAGTAVGITSLGIQTCQILHRYYSQFKGRQEDVDNVLRQVEGLQGILESLRDVKGRFEIDNHAASSQLHLAQKACEEALAKLKKMADKCNTTQRPESIQDPLEDMKKRALWPNRKETLAELQQTLSRFKDNISLALQSAGLDVVLRRVGDTMS